MTNTEMLPLEAERNPVVRIDNGEVMADSRDVATYFGKRHDHVLRDIDGLIGHAPDLGDRQFQRVSSPHPTIPGRVDRSFKMTRDGFSLLAMGFTGAKALKWKLRYIDAFNAMDAELRSRPAVDPMAVLNDPAAMRGLLLTYTEKVMALEGEVAVLGPKADALDRIATADGSLCVTDAAKTLQMRPSDLFSYLRSHGWLYRRPGTSHDIGYQSKLIAGLLEHKVTTVLRADGSEKVTEQVRITPKGLTHLAKLMSPVARRAA